MGNPECKTPLPPAVLATPAALLRVGCSGKRFFFGGWWACSVWYRQRRHPPLKRWRHGDTIFPGVDSRYLGGRRTIILKGQRAKRKVADLPRR